MGNQTNFAYSALDDLTQIMDEDGNLTLFAYDADRNLVSVTDANGGITSYGYDSMDRRTSRTDPLSHAELSQYDGNGNLTQFTDRRGEVTVYQYDGLDRRTSADFDKGKPDESTISYTWDGGDRMTQAVDSIAGTISRSYDGLDDLLAESTPPGSITYQYDGAKRRTSMTVSGQPAISYAWDNANRLTGITAGAGSATSVAFSYDSADRRTSLTLPNGVVLSYAYDNASRVTGMNWMSALSQVGDLEYSYDADGHVIEKTGSLASTGIPSAVSGNTFNGANELTSFNGATLTYDLNGNLLNDGSNSYTWDARNHLSTLTGSGTLPTTASFIYDALDRRLEKTINQQTTAFLYDGLNPVQELMPSGLGQFAPTATMLSGLSLNEFFQRIDQAGQQIFITDDAESTLALTNTLGSITTSYTYEPFGAVVVSPVGVSANPYQFYGSDNDGTGLDYGSDGYYQPSVQRIIAESWGTGVDQSPDQSNPYPYAADNPINFGSALQSNFDPAAEVATTLPLPVQGPIDMPVEGGGFGGEIGGPLIGLGVSGLMCLANSSCREFLKDTWEKCKRIRCKAEYHGPHHRFPRIGRACHLQVTCWSKGRKGSDVRIRIPIPCMGRYSGAR